MGKVCDATKSWFRAMKGLREAGDANARMKARAVAQGAFNELLRAYACSPHDEWDDGDREADAEFERFGG